MIEDISENRRPSEILFNRFLGDIDNVYLERDSYKKRVEELEKQISENLKKDIENHSEMANSMMNLVLNHTVIKNDENDYTELFNAIFEKPNQSIDIFGDGEVYGDAVPLDEFIYRCKKLNLKFKITKQG
jgi:hypothetical protein